MYKTCSRCKENKTIYDFGKNKTRKDGLHYYCKSCTKTISQKIYYNNREKYLLKGKNYRKNNKEMMNKKVREKYQNNENLRKKRSLYLKKRRLKNLNHYRKREREYYCKNRDKKIEQHNKRKKEFEDKLDSLTTPSIFTVCEIPKSYTRQYKKEYMKEHNKKYRLTSKGKKYEKKRSKDPKRIQYKKEYMKEYNQIPEVKKRSKQWYIENIDKKKQYNKNFYEDHKEVKNK